MNSKKHHVGLLAITTFILAPATGCAHHKSVQPDYVTEAAVLAYKLNRPSDIRILDVRDAEAYERGHVAGAVRVDPKQWKELSLAAPTGLDHQLAWHERIGRIGISGGEEIIIYDSGDMTDAARIWFILQHFGVKQASVLNGGYPAIKDLIKNGRIPVSQTPSPPISARFHPVKGSDPAIKLTGWQHIRHAIQRQEAQILDTRSKAEYMGVDQRDNPRAGHLPGAINLPYKDLLDERGYLKSTEELAAIFARAGFQRGKPIITYCQSGGRASLAALAAEQAGYGPVLNYYLSFGDWAKNASCPIVKDEER